MTQEEIRHLHEDLHTPNGAKVTFTKKNGDTRIMTACLHEDRIPDEHKPKGTQIRPENFDLVHVFDLDAIGWRSIRYDSISWWYVA